MSVSYQQVFENNRAWVAAQLAIEPGFFDELNKGQSPDFLFIGCSDSRVPPAQVMGLGPGDVFVHRNVANVVAHNDANVQAVIHYAVEHLGVKHIVVCGHTQCGGVGAAMSRGDMGALNGYVRLVRDVAAKHAEELSTLDADARYRRLIELNVQEQCLNILATPWVQARASAGDAPTVHGWIFELHSGLLVDLKLDFDALQARVRGAYLLDV